MKTKFVLVILLFTISALGQQAEPQLQDSPSSQNCSEASVLNGTCQPSKSAGQTQVPATQIPQQNDVRVPQLANPRTMQPQYAPEETRYPETLNPSDGAQQLRTRIPSQPKTEFEQMVADSAGRYLPIFGQSMFTEIPSTFAPADRVQVPSDYVIGPGDELQIKIWGQVDADLQAKVDRSGQVYVPRVGPIMVAGVSYRDLQSHLRQEIGKLFRNFDLSVAIGKLRSIQVFVVGQARFPGTYTIGSLSTLVNALFACGGPSVQGSLREIEVRREGKIITTFDFYDLLLKGDKSKDVHLQSGDVIFIPHVGPLAAISGSVNVPAIYETKPSTSLSDLIDIAGGLSSVADSSKVVVERIQDHESRKVIEFPMDQEAQSFRIQDGDIVRIFSIVPKFDNAVTLRGSVTNPGRFPWKPGMRIKDLLPSADYLLTRDYWLNRAAISNGRETEYPVITNQSQSMEKQDAVSGQMVDRGRTVRRTGAISTSRLPGNLLAPNGQDRPQITSETLTTDLKTYAPEINWHYATVQRVNPTDLSTKLLSFDLEKAILQGDPEDNLELQPGDIVTIFSQTDISVPQDLRSRYVILEGEVMRPGVYKVEPGETLPSLLKRAGGLSPKAYLYGIQLTRESARIEQQKSIDELVRTLQLQSNQSQTEAASSGTVDPQTLAARQMFQNTLISQVSGFRATGRVVLNVKPHINSIDALPEVQMEDKDKVIIPHEPSTVAVVGFVYNPGSFLYENHNSAGGYLRLAGNTRPHADVKHAFILRANGTVVARTSVNGLFSGDQFASLRLNPGDQLVIPSKIETGAWVRGLRDWTQIASQLALTGAALAVIH